MKAWRSIFERKIRMQLIELEHERIFFLTEKTKDLNIQNGLP